VAKWPLLLSSYGWALSAAAADAAAAAAAAAVAAATPGTVDPIEFAVDSLAGSGSAWSKSS